MYKLGFILSFLMGGLVYYVLSLIWPPSILPGNLDRNGKPAFEALAANEGFFEHESVATITGVLDSQASETGSEEIYVVEGKVVAEKQAEAMV
jgi:NCS1 family nucleobase:cation symporter-1